MGSRPGNIAALDGSLAEQVIGTRLHRMPAGRSISPLRRIFRGALDDARSSAIGLGE